MNDFVGVPERRRLRPACCYGGVKVAEIRNYVKPRRLYRYRSIEHIDRELEAIEDGYLFCAAYKDMNDPMEGVYSASERLRRSSVYRNFEIDILSDKRRLGICSFSEVHNHELMWAHYASRFKGIRIEYDLIQLLKRGRLCAHAL